MGLKMEIPPGAAVVLEGLERHGFSAYLVGGCVRDGLLGQSPGDWDVATDALPEQVIRCFRRHPVLKTGLQHGTVTVLVDRVPYEVTTFRVDGAYTDHRRPDQVHFTDSLTADLRRRDFTINAMAYHPRHGLQDPLGGADDLKRRRIACVGEAAERFGEDALRILRAVRFASVLDFKIAPATAAAMADQAPLLRHVAVERIQVELSKAILGRGLERVFGAHQAVLRQVLPEVCGGGWEQRLRGASLAEPDLSVRLALLLGAEQEAAVNALIRLRFDNKTRKRVAALVEQFPQPIPISCPAVKRLLHQMGAEDFARLLGMWRAAATAWDQPERCAQLEQAETVLRQVQEEGQCYTLEQLAVGGKDLLAAGIPRGKAVGAVLEQLLCQVTDDRLPNHRPVLLDAGKRLWKDMEQGEH